MIGIAVSKNGISIRLTEEMCPLNTDIILGSCNRARTA